MQYFAGFKIKVPPPKKKNPKPVRLNDRSRVGHMQPVVHHTTSITDALACTIAKAK